LPYVPARCMGRVAIMDGSP